jgi:hypothetical protein
MLRGSSDWNEPLGCTWDYSGTIVAYSAPGVAGVPTNLTPYKGLMQIRDEDGALKLELTTELPAEAPRIVFGTGTFRLRITDLTQAEIEAALPVGEYEYSLAYGMGDDGYRPIFGGKFTIFKDTSYKEAV